MNMSIIKLGCCRKILVFKNRWENVSCCSKFKPFQYIYIYLNKIPTELEKRINFTFVVWLKI